MFMDLLLRKTRKLERQTDEYLDLVIRGALVFKEGMKCYLRGQQEQFRTHMRDLETMESNGDTLRRSIETRLYMDTLIPEYRGDVLGLLESADRVLNRMAETLAQFDIEMPEVLDDFKTHYLDLTDAAMSTVEFMVSAVRAYFREPDKVRDYINKAMFYEKQSDSIGDRIKRNVFRTDLELSRKVHMRFFAHHIETIADEAEDVCDRLAIATIKRSL
jgi:predicted phosphate transport protein (TIGR00153 family)